MQSKHNVKLTETELLYINRVLVFVLLSWLKGQMNQNFDLFYFSSILVKCV